MVTEDKTDSSYSRTKIIEAIIVAATFVLILVLCIVTKENSGNAASGTVIAVRVGLLFVVAAVYFWMLYRTRVSRNSKKETPGGKK
ncbi:MAG: hypothetical protein HY801_07480 [Candidatus Lindowbacteria bacterium]|nr:hypothetical protein [Candidatus Lindowbacteria bacterium]